MLALLVCLGIASPAWSQNLPPNVPPPPGAVPAGQQQAQQPKPGQSMTSTTELVVLHVTVVDEKGEFVTGLTQRQFKSTKTR